MPTALQGSLWSDNSDSIPHHLKKAPERSTKSRTRLLTSNPYKTQQKLNCSLPRLYYKNLKSFHNLLKHIMELRPHYTSRVNTHANIKLLWSWR